MRRIYFGWIVAVTGVVAFVYGGYTLIWHLNHGNGVKPLALILLILGFVCLCFTIVLLVSRHIASKKKKDVLTQAPQEEPEPKPEEEPEPESEPEPEPKPEEKSEPAEEEQTEEEVEFEEIPPAHRERSRPSPSVYDASTIYVRLVGYGPVLRFHGPRVLDMRTNTYYRIEDDFVYEEGGGPHFEIRGNQIRDLYGGYLYELSGSHINKVFGGFYASISGNYVTLYDSSRKYETDESLSRRQILTMAALLFDR